MVLPTRRTQEPRRPLPSLRGWTRKFSSFLRFQQYKSDQVSVSSVIVALDGSGDFDNIQAAIDSLPETGGHVHIKAGTYTTTAQITINKSNVRITGAGKSTMIVATGDYFVFLAVSQTDINFENISITGNGGSSGAHIGIVLVNVTRSTISGCFVTNISPSGGGGGMIADEGSSNILFTNCNCSSNGFGIAASDNDMKVTDNICNSNNGDGIGINGDKIIVRGNTCNNNGTNGIISEGGSECLIENNICDTNGTYGVQLESEVTKTTIVGNRLTNNATAPYLDTDGVNQIGHNTTD